MIKKITQKNLWTHIFFVTLFLIVPTLAFVRLPGEPFFSLTKVLVSDTVANFILLCFFYLNYYILLPRFFYTRKYFQYFLYVVGFLYLAFTLSYFIGNQFPSIEKLSPLFKQKIPYNDLDGPPSLLSNVFEEFRRHLSLFFSAIFFSFLLRTREHLSQLKEEKLQAELTSLKAQINPHFLFNTLNSIYALSVKKDSKTSEAIINLSGLMRYVIKDANDNRITLQKEIDYIRNYIELQKARLGNTAAVYFEVTGTCGSKEIAPLILITYIENAFKYGVNPDADESVVEIKIEITDTGLSLFVFNKIVPVAESIESTGIGITNTAERLKLLYPGRHSINIKESIETYSVTLSIELV